MTHYPLGGGLDFCLRGGLACLKVCHDFEGFQGLGVNCACAQGRLFSANVLDVVGLTSLRATKGSAAILRVLAVSLKGLLSAFALAFCDSGAYGEWRVVSA